MEKESEKIFNESVEDFFKKFPNDLNRYDFWVRFSQTLIQMSDKNESTKSISHNVANSIIKALDNRNNNL